MNAARLDDITRLRLQIFHWIEQCGDLGLKNSETRGTFRTDEEWDILSKEPLFPIDKLHGTLRDGFVFWWRKTNGLLQKIMEKLDRNPNAPLYGDKKRLEELLFWIKEQHDLRFDVPLPEPEEASLELQVKESAASPGEEDFSHSDGYSTVKIRGDIYNLSPQQAQVIKMLDDECEARGKAGTLYYKNILKEVHLLNPNGPRYNRLQEIFRTNRPAFNALCKHVGKPRGHYRLNL